MNAAIFYCRLGLFSFYEQFGDLTAGFFGYLIFPVILVVQTAMWQKFNSQYSALDPAQIAAFFAVVQVLFMTFLRNTYFGLSSSNFELALARPRSWLASSSTYLFGRILAARLIFLLAMGPWMIAFGLPVATAAQVCLRLIVLLAPLTLIAALVNLILANAQIVSPQTGYFALPISKIFMVFGGVLGPLTAYTSSIQSLAIQLPPADLFFQPAYFCVTGHFFEISSLTWCMHCVYDAAGLLVTNVLFFRFARHHHQAFGG